MNNTIICVDMCMQEHTYGFLLISQSMFDESILAYGSDEEDGMKYVRGSGTASQYKQFNIDLSLH